MNEFRRHPPRHRILLGSTGANGARLIRLNEQQGEGGRYVRAKRGFARLLGHFPGCLVTLRSPLAVDTSESGEYGSSSGISLCYGGKQLVGFVGGVCIRIASMPCVRGICSDKAVKRFREGSFRVRIEMDFLL